VKHNIRDVFSIMPSERPNLNFISQIFIMLRKMLDLATKKKRFTKVINSSQMEYVASDILDFNPTQHHVMDMAPTKKVQVMSFITHFYKQYKMLD